MSPVRQSFIRDRAGNIGISAALVMPLVVLSVALGVDYAYLSAQRRTLQSEADVAAIVVAANIDKRDSAAIDHFRANGLEFWVKTKTGYSPTNGITTFDEAAAVKKGIASIMVGRYVPDAKISAPLRFIETETQADAVRVSIRKQGEFFIAGMFATPPVLGATGTAARPKTAAFSVGSRLASLNDGLLNALLGQMLGTRISLDVMDYNALLDADIDMKPFLKALATDLNLTAGTYDDVLQADLTMPQLLKSMRAVGGLSTAAASALKALGNAVSKNNKTFELAEIINIDPKRNLKIDAGSKWTMEVSAFQMISAAAALANGKNQIAVDTGISLPGLASVEVTLAVGEPPVETPSHKLGTVGSAVRTAQTRLAVNVGIAGLATLVGLKIDLPLYVEVAYAEARLSDIRCYGGLPTNAAVSVDVVPGIAEIAIGKVDPSILSDFSTEARVKPARLVDSLLVKIDGIAHVEAKNFDRSKLTFSPSEIAAGKIKNVSTKDALTSATQSLLKNLDAEVTLPLIKIGTPDVILAALAQTLGGVTPQIDQLIYNLLLLVGVKVGEADVRVTGVGCQPAVLVQ